MLKLFITIYIVLLLAACKTTPENTDYTTEGFLDANTFQVRAIYSREKMAAKIDPENKRPGECFKNPALERVKEILVGPQICGTGYCPPPIKLEPKFEKIIAGGKVVRSSYEKGMCTVTFRIVYENVEQIFRERALR